MMRSKKRASDYLSPRETKTKHLITRMTPELHERLAKASKDIGRSLNEIGIAAFEMFLDALEEERKKK